MMTKSLVERLLEKALLDTFIANEFECTRYSPLQFKRRFEGGFESCIFALTENKGKFWIELSFGLRIDDIELLANQFTFILKPYQEETHTIMTSYGRMINQNYFRYKVSNEAEIEKAASTFRSFLEQEGFDFLQSHHSVKHLDELINNEPTDTSKFIYNASHRCLKGIIIAKMSQNPKFSQLAQLYHQELQKTVMGERVLPGYKRLVTHLAAFSLN
ncbi:MAG: hypothetical protein ACPGXL_05525 [Chitinophagales bacterium]